MGLHIKHWLTGAVLYEHDGDNLREAVETAVAKGICLNGASLVGASLDGASLDRASLDRASLDGASLDGASLNGANLTRANLTGASLNGANLTRANLTGASLYGANLTRANLNRADLTGANLIGADLDGEALRIAPVAVTGLRWHVLITPIHMTIGCQRHTHEAWAAFPDDVIAQMEGNGEALPFWTRWKHPLLSICAAHRAAHEAKTATDAGAPA